MQSIEASQRTFCTFVFILVRLFNCQGYYRASSDKCCYSQPGIELETIRLQDNHEKHYATQATQRTFTYKITKAQHLNCRKRLQKLKLYSIHRRRERYIITYVCKIKQDMMKKYRQYNEGRHKNQKPSKTCMEHSVSLSTQHTETQSTVSQENARTWFGPTTL